MIRFLLLELAESCRDTLVLWWDGFQQQQQDGPVVMWSLLSGKDDDDSTRTILEALSVLGCAVLILYSGDFCYSLLQQICRVLLSSSRDALPNNSPNRRPGWSSWLWAWRHRKKLGEFTASFLPHPPMLDITEVSTEEEEGEEDDDDASSLHILIPRHAANGGAISPLTADAATTRSRHSENSASSNHRKRSSNNHQQQQQQLQLVFQKQQEQQKRGFSIDSIPEEDAAGAAAVEDNWSVSTHFGEGDGHHHNNQQQQHKCEDDVATVNRSNASPRPETAANHNNTGSATRSHRLRRSVVPAATLKSQLSTGGRQLPARFQRLHAVSTQALLQASAATPKPPPVTTRPSRRKSNVRSNSQSQLGASSSSSALPKPRRLRRSSSVPVDPDLQPQREPIVIDMKAGSSSRHHYHHSSLARPQFQRRVSEEACGSKHLREDARLLQRMARSVRPPLDEAGTASLNTSSHTLRTIHIPSTPSSTTNHSVLSSP